MGCVNINTYLVFHPIISLSLEGTVVTLSNDCRGVSRFFPSASAGESTTYYRYFKINLCSGNFPIGVSAGGRAHLKHFPSPRPLVTSSRGQSGVLPWSLDVGKLL